MVAAHLDVNTAAAGAVHRAAAAWAAVASHERRDVHLRPPAELLPVDAARDHQQLIADHFGLQPADRHAVQQVVVRIHFRASQVRFARLPVRLREHHLPDQVLDRPAAIHNLRREIIEQLRMRRRLAGDAEVVNRLDDAPAEQVMPNPIHRHARNERVAGINHPLGQGHTAAS